VPHVVGLVLCQVAFWLGYWQLSADKPFAEALTDATIQPLVGMMVILPCTVVFLLMVYYTILFRTWDSNARRRGAWVVLSYLLMAGHWCLGSIVAKALASPGLLIGPLD
jgi:hypothetical protein